MNKLFVLLPAAMLMLTACGGGEASSVSVSSSEETTSEETTSAEDSSSEESSEEAVDYGTLENPISVYDAMVIAATELGDEAGTLDKEVYVKGVMRYEGKEGWNSQYENYTSMLRDEAKANKSLVLFRALSAEGLETIAYENDVIIASGYLQNYEKDGSITLELAASGDNKAYVHAVTVGNSPITVTAENCVVSELASEVANGTEITFTVTANEGYKVADVKVNGTIINAEEDGSYKYKVVGDTAIVPNIVTDDTPVTDYGSVESPITVSAALAIAETECATDGAFTAKAVVVKGTVANKPTVNGTYGWKNINLTDGEKTLLVYTVNFGDVEKVFKNDEFTVSGFMKNYGGTLEITNNGSDYPAGVARVAGTSAISLVENANATVTNLPESAVNDAEVTFNVVANDGYQIVSVKANGTALEGTDGAYTMVMAGDMEVEVEVKEAGKADDVVVATFTCGEDGEASHKDGSAVESYTETVGDYTLTIADGVKLYSGALDATGNGCLKLGTGKAAASFSITLPEGVDYAIILISGYKANDAIVSVNGGDSVTITEHSDDGVYNELKAEPVDGKITFATVSGGYRAMINGVVFMAAAE